MLAPFTRSGHISECLLAGEEIRKLSRDLRILVATNGTLTRILGMVADEEISVEIINQQIHRVRRETGESGQLSGGRVLQRHVLLTGRKSGHRFVAAESLISVDLLPREITASLANSECPIGEIMAASRIETFKESADVWLGELPGWIADSGYEASQPKAVGRRYRIIIGGKPAIIITEYFLESISEIRHRDEPNFSRPSKRYGCTGSERIGPHDQ